MSDGDLSCRLLKIALVILHADPARGGAERYTTDLAAALTQRTDLKAAYIRLTVRQGRNIMPRTRKTEVSDSDLDAIVAYLTSNNKQ